MWRKRTAAAAETDHVDAPAAPGVMRSLEALLHDLPGLVSDRVHLLALELKRAGAALAQIVGLLIATAVLVVTAWLTAWVALAVAALRAGVPWGWVVAVVLLLNLGAAGLALLRVRALAKCLTLPATKRRLTIAPIGEVAGAPPVPAGPSVMTTATLAGDGLTVLPR